MKEIIGNIKSAKTEEAMKKALEEYIVKAPMEVAIDVSTLSTLPGKQKFIVEFIKEIIDSGRFVESHNFFICFKNNLFETFKKYQYGINRKKLQETNGKSVDRRKRQRSRKVKD